MQRSSHRAHTISKSATGELVILEAGQVVRGLAISPLPGAPSACPELHRLPGMGRLCGCESGAVGGGVTGFSASLFSFLSSLLDGGMDGGASRLIRVGWAGRAGQPHTPQRAQLCRLPPSPLLEVQESRFSLEMCTS